MFKKAKRIFFYNAHSLLESSTLRVILKFPPCPQMSCTQPQPSFSLTMPFPYECEESEEERDIESTLIMPRSQLEATQDLSPTLLTAMVSPPAIARIQSSDDIEDSQESLPKVPSTFSFLPSAASQSPISEPTVLRRPLTLLDSSAQPQNPRNISAFPRPRIIRKKDLKFARACFAGEFQSISIEDDRSLRSGKGKKVKLKKIKAKGLNPSFVDLVRGVCGIFTTQTGKHANLEKVCASFFQ